MVLERVLQLVREGLVAPTRDGFVVGWGERDDVLVRGDRAVPVNRRGAGVAFALDRSRELNRLHAGLKRLGKRVLHGVLDALLEAIQDSHRPIV